MPPSPRPAWWQETMQLLRAALLPPPPRLSALLDRIERLP